MLPPSVHDVYLFVALLKEKMALFLNPLHMSFGDEPKETTSANAAWPCWPLPVSATTAPLRFFSLSLFECLYRVMHWSDCCDHLRTINLQAVLVMPLFPSLVLTLSDASRVHVPRTSANETTGSMN